jgi:hypothetical protein
MLKLKENSNAICHTRQAIATEHRQKSMFTRGVVRIGLIYKYKKRKKNVIRGQFLYVRSVVMLSPVMKFCI